MKSYTSLVFLLFIVLLVSSKYTTSLTNGIIGQFMHLFSMKCLLYDPNYSSTYTGSSYFGSCTLSNQNNLFQIFYYDSSQNNFFIVLYPQDSSTLKYILYQTQPSYFYWTNSDSYCLMSQGCYYYLSQPEDYFKFYANFTRGDTNNPLGSFTLKNKYTGNCIALDLNDAGSYVLSLVTCNPADFRQVFVFLNPDTYLLSQITSTVSSDNTGLTVQWSNPNKVSNVVYMLIPGNQSLSDQGTLNLQSVKCSSQNGLSPLSFTSSGTQVSTTITINNMKNCNIYSNSNETVTTYILKAIHVFLDNNVGFSRTIQVTYSNKMSLDQTYLVGQYTDSNEQTQVFESAVSSVQITNLISMSFSDSIGQAYLEKKLQTMSVTLNSSSKYSLTIVGNSMTLISVNSQSNQVLTQNLPCSNQIAGVNTLNISFDFTNITTNYYKFKIVVKIMALSRLLQSNSTDEILSKNTVAEFDSHDSYYIGSEIEIEELIKKTNSLQNLQTEDKGSESNANKTAVIALSVVVSCFVLSLVLGFLAWRRKKNSSKSTKSSHKTGLKYNEPTEDALKVKNEEEPNPIIEEKAFKNQEIFVIEEVKGVDLKDVYKEKLSPASLNQFSGGDQQNERENPPPDLVSQQNNGAILSGKDVGQTLQVLIFDESESTEN